MRTTKWFGGTIILVALAALIDLAAPQSVRAEISHHGLEASFDGPTLYRIYCAVCHGEGAEGDGPMATILKAHVPDLTKIADRNGGAFPISRVQEVISGAKRVGLGHGTKEMPIWGPVFAQLGPTSKDGKLRVYSLTKYLQSIQKARLGQGVGRVNK